MFSHAAAQLILLTLFMYNNNEKKQKEYKKKEKKMKIDRNNNNSDKINIKIYCQKEEKKMGHVKERLPVVGPGCKWIKVKEGRNEII